MTDPVLLERLREESGLRLDAEGDFWHRGERVEHARTIETLRRGIHRAPDGRWATRIGQEWGYLAVDDAAYQARTIAPTADGRLALALDDGRLVTIDPASLAIGAADAVYARLPDGERARLTRAAQQSLAALLEEGPSPGAPPLLTIGGRSCRLGTDTGPEPRRPPSSRA